MNFLKELLSDASESDVELSDKQLSTLSSKVSQYKSDVVDYMSNINDTYYEWPKKSATLLNEVNTLFNEIDNLKDKIETITLTDLATSQLQINTFKYELQQSKIATNYLILLMEIHDKLFMVREYKNDENYVRAIFELVEVEKLLKNLPPEAMLDVVHSIKSNLTLEKTFLMRIMNDSFVSMLLIKEGKVGLMQTNVIKIDKNKQELQDVINVLDLVGELPTCLNNLKNSLWSYICKPILNFVTQIRIDDDEDFYILTVFIKRTTATKAYKDVFENLIQFFSFIYKHLNQEIAETNIKLYLQVANDLKYDLCNALIKDCLPDTLANPTDRGIFQKITEDTRKFHNELVKLGVFTADFNPILEYSNNMDSMFVNLKCEEYTVEAITIMKKDLHDMVEVGVQFDSFNPLTGDQFPECTISISSVELMEKSKKLLEQALTETPIMAARIICALQSIFYQYGSIVHAHHERLLQTIPQQVVLYRNNCMYLAHHLCILNEMFSSKFPKTVLPVPPIFKDQPHQLRTVGGDIFLGYVETHIKGIETTLAEHQFESQQLREAVCENADKCIRQCLRQFELLRTVWHKVLPHAVYNKTLGYLVNTFCKKIVIIVTDAPDISAKNCQLLVDIFKIVLTRAPKLFTDPDEVNLYVEVWQKFNGLVFILTADLLAIEKNWKSGYLSSYFTVEEVKHLIKAIFQNTERRSQVLSHIVSNKS